MQIILFDIDGTLITTGGAGQSAMDIVSADHGTLDADPSQVSYSGRTDKSIIRDHLRLFGIEETAANYAAYRADFLTKLPKQLADREGQVLPSVVETLEKLMPTSLELGLITGNMRAAAKMKLDHYGLSKYFYTRPEAMGGFGDEHFERDDMAREALVDVKRRLGSSVAPDQIWVVGDTPRDVQCARAIGAKVLAVATGRFDYDQLAATSPDLVCESLADADAWWAQLELSNG
jgi:phosphoglycolate phosphatase-like HAD superfamily hydrolase